MRRTQFGTPDRFDKMFLRLPIAFDWVEYKGETVFASLNYEATVKAGKPMMDIHYCATEALNGTVMFVAQWDKKKFGPSRLAVSKWNIHNQKSWTKKAQPPLMASASFK